MPVLPPPRLRALLPIALIGLLSSCGAEIAAPSLMPRAVERQPIELPEAEREAEAPVDPALAGQIAPLVASAEAGDKVFQEQRKPTEAAIAHAGAAGSEAWVLAQQALTALEALRGPARDAAAAIEALRVDPAYAGPASRAAIEAAAQRIEATDAAEVTVLAGLSAKLG